MAPAVKQRPLYHLAEHRGERRESPPGFDDVHRTRPIWRISAYIAIAKRFIKIAKNATCFACNSSFKYYYG